MNLKITDCLGKIRCSQNILT